MKKLLILSIIILFISCTGYRKDMSVCSYVDEEPYYRIRVFGPEITNSGALKIYKLPMKDISDFKVDSLNREADKFIRDCEKYSER